MCWSFLIYFVSNKCNALLCRSSVHILPLSTFNLPVYSVSSSLIACSCKHRRISAPKASAVSYGNRGRIQVGFKLKGENMLTPNESSQPKKMQKWLISFYCILLNYCTHKTFRKVIGLAWTGCSVLVSILTDFVLVHIFRNPSPFPTAPSAQRVPEAVDQQNGASTTCLAKWIGCE